MNLANIAIKYLKKKSTSDKSGLSLSLCSKVLFLAKTIAANITISPNVVSPPILIKFSYIIQNKMRYSPTLVIHKKKSAQFFISN